MTASIPHPLDPLDGDEVRCVFAHEGSLNVSVGAEQLSVGSGFSCPLLLGNLEFFRFSPSRTTVHSWAHYWSAVADAKLIERLSSAVPVQRISAALARLVGDLLSAPPVPLDQ